MQDRTPRPRDQRPPLPDFTPVPRKCKRHDGWTPERQRAFIEALADTGSVETACRQVNMASVGAYALRRHPAAGPFSAAWDAALAMGWKRLKDDAFERALNGQLVPVFVGGKLMGYRRKKNDRLLMFVLRHYGPDGPLAEPRPHLTVNVLNATATATAVSASPDPGEGPVVEGTPPHAIPAGIAPALPAPAAVPDARDVVAGFAGVPLDDEAEAQILAVLTANAARQRATAPEDDPAVPFVSAADIGEAFLGELEGGAEAEDAPDRKPGEVRWQLLGDEPALARLDEARAEIAAAKARGDWPVPAGAQVAPSTEPALPPEPAPPLSLPAPAPMPPCDGERRSDGMDWLSEQDRQGVDHIDAMIEAAKAESRAERAAGARPGRKRRLP